MKIKNYANFYHLLGKLTGIAEVIDHQKTSNAIIKIVRELDEVWTQVSSDQVIEKTIVRTQQDKPRKKVAVGSVRQPSAEMINKSPKEAETESAVEETLDDIIGTKKAFEE